MLHLHAGLALENEGGPRARVRVPRDGGLHAHVSCLAEQAKILFAEAEENNLGDKVMKRGGNGGTRAACASRSTTASWRVRSGGRAGRRDVAARGLDQIQEHRLDAVGNGLRRPGTTPLTSLSVEGGRRCSTLRRIGNG